MTRPPELPPSDDLDIAAPQRRARRRVDPDDLPPTPTGDIAPLEAWAASAGIPGPTLDAVRAAGAGPKVFTIGRRLYAHRRDWSAWCVRMADTGGVRLSGRKAQEGEP